MTSLSRRAWLAGLLAAPAAMLIAEDTRKDDHVVTLLADAYCPINCAPGENPPGYGVEIARRIFEARGYQVHYLEADWEAAVQRVRKGEADAVLAAFKSDAPDFVFPTEPLGRANYCYFVRPGSAWSYQGQPSLAHVRIGVIRGYSYGSALDRYIAQQGPGPRVFVAEGREALGVLMDLLARGEIQALIEDSSVVAYKLKRQPKHGPLREAGCESSGSMYAAFSPAPSRLERSRRLAAIWDEGMESLRQSGALAAIRSRYR